MKSLGGKPFGRVVHVGAMPHLAGKSSPPKAPKSSASITLRGGHVGGKMPRVGSRVRVVAVGKVKGFSHEHSRYDSDDGPRQTMDLDLDHIEHGSHRRKSMSDGIAERQSARDGSVDAPRRAKY